MLGLKNMETPIPSNAGCLSGTPSGTEKNWVQLGMVGPVQDQG